MKKLISFLLLSLVLLFAVSACTTTNEEKDIFEFKDSVVGDNTAVSTIVNQLQAADDLKQIQLETKEKPYGIKLDYNWSDSEEKYKKTAIFNATFLFTLIPNVDWVTFNFDSKEYTVTREDLMTWYGEDFSQFENEADLKGFIEKYLENEEKVNELFK